MLRIQAEALTFDDVSLVPAHSSVLPKDVRDEPGSGGGVITRVHMKVSHSKQHSRNVYVNGHAVVRTDDQMHMNTKKP